MDTESCEELEKNQMKTVIMLYSVGTFIYGVFKKHNEKKKKREADEEDEG